MELAVSSTTPIPFKLRLSSDHVSPALGVVPSVVIAKNGGAFVTPAGAVSEVGNGWYQLTPTAADTNLVGSLVLHATATSCDPANARHVVGTEPVVLGSTNPLPFFLVQSSDHLTGLTGAAPSVLLAKGGGTFSAAQGAVLEMAFGWYKLTPTAVDTGTLGALLLYATAASADSVDDEYTVELGVSGATYGSAYLLDQFNRLTSRPTVDEVTDQTKYRILADAQNRVIADVAARAPKVLVGPPQLLTTTDNKVYTFGTDSNGYPVFPMGNVRLFTSLSNVPDYPLQEGYDYAQEGTQVRIPNNRTFPGPLYWTGIQQPADITATVQPSLYPEAARRLIVLEAAREFMHTQNRPDRYDDLGQEYAKELSKWLLVWRRQFSNGGGLVSATGLRAALLDGPVAA